LLLTGAGGLDRCAAAAKVAADIGVVIRTVRVGPGGDVDDPDSTWAAMRGIDDDGALLVRPDGHVGFRSPSAVDDPYAALRDAVSVVLGHSLRR
jgi:hypothetical protein